MVFQPGVIMPSSQLNGLLPPFELPSNIVYFHDWRYVDHGYLRWLGPDDKPVKTMPAPDPLPPTHSDLEWVPRGVRIQAIEADIAEEPVLRSSQMNEVLFWSGSVIHEAGRYRLFYE